MRFPRTKNEIVRSLLIVGSEEEQRGVALLGEELQRRLVLEWSQNILLSDSFRNKKRENSLFYVSAPLRL